MKLSELIKLISPSFKERKEAILKKKERRKKIKEKTKKKKPTMGSSYVEKKPHLTDYLFRI